MARTLANIRQGAGRLLSIRTFYGTAAASGNTTTNLRCAATRRFPTGWFAGAFLLVTSGSASGTTFYCTAFTTTNGAFTVIPAAGGAAYFDSATFEVYPVDPSVMTDIINKSARQLYPWISRAVVEEQFGTSTPFWNPGFNEWTSSTAATGWTATDLTLTRGTSTGNIGQYRARISTATGDLSLSGANVRDLAYLLGSSVTFYALVSTDVADSVRLRIVDGTGTVATGSYNTSTNNYEVLSVTGTISTTRPEDINFRILLDSASATADIHVAWLEGPVNYMYRVPAEMTRGPTQIFIAPVRDRSHFRHYGWKPATFRLYRHENANATTGYQYIELLDKVPANYALMLVGRDPLTTLSAETDNAEVDIIGGEILEHQVALNLLSSSMSATAGDRHAAYEALYARLLRQRNEIWTSVREPGQPAHLPHDV